MTQLELVLEEIIIERPQDIEQHLCADKGYDGQDALKIIVSKGYTPPCEDTRGRDPGEKSQSHLESQKVGC